MNVRILYLDDDPAIVRLVQKALGRNGHSVTHAEDLERALGFLASENFDVIVLDHYLSNMTGHDVLAHLRGRHIMTPVVYVTGSNEARIAIDAIKAGASDYVIKTTSEDFLSLLESAIRQSVENARLREAKVKADEEIRLAKERAEALLSEVNHRVANSLALVASLLRLQIANSPSDEVKAELTETQARITAIAGMHRSLYTSDDVSRVDMDIYIANLVREIGGSLANPDKPITLTVDAEPISLTADRAVSIGMIVTELVTNAIKYAYPDRKDGEIRVRLCHAQPGHALLTVEDDGIGISPGAAPKGTGLGSRIIKSMAATLGEGLAYQEIAAGTIACVPIDLAR
ncbi:response regulator [Agrobacterium vitis]|uniref:histidine kinase n=1 Tax=Agrobacterium vitis TaxID=373 RepID=A0AAE4WBQ5_AGRVI|nr:histidine kinase dimerization/phosphoacceptor domain -containing protein [Agrobacterium vitis]MCF1499222.1 response regulator [Allorhizobium sp. Av2]MCM2439532.1 response regulator [Agrobacterium vitis]MUZ57569.1 response regulator [Agrobacterium vitis]MVA68128.1 response regulator [Agrobacterium vitis]MVA87848.1 response regulator [Agrobacterium vitis]